MFTFVLDSSEKVLSKSECFSFYNITKIIYYINIDMIYLLIWNRECTRKDEIIKIRNTNIIDTISFIKFLIYIVLKYYLAYLMFYRMVKIL